jgi:hypothetical protein
MISLQQRQQPIAIRTVPIRGQQFVTRLLDLSALRGVERVIVVEFLSVESCDVNWFGNIAGDAGRVMG